MKIKNEWVGYLTRSHIQIKNSLLKRLGQKNPEITDHSESNILVIIISMFSGVAEMLNYYIDNMAREAFITTARRYSSVVKHTRLIDYRIKAAIAASVDIRISFKDNDENYVGSPVQFIIPKGTKFHTNNNIPFLSTKDVTVKVGDIHVIIPAEQKTLQENMVLGITNGDSEQTLALNNNYVNGTLYLKVGGEVWDNVNTLGLKGPNDKVYIVDIAIDKTAYVKFGDNINGATPAANLEVIGDYYTTLAEEGNVDIGNIVSTEFMFSNIPGFDIDNIEITNLLKATGGTTYETIERIRRSAPLSLRTLDRAVTKQDYIDIALLSPGVDKATVHFNCGKYVNIYISPIGGGIAQTALIDSTKLFIEDRKMITTFINVSAAGESYIVIDLDVTGKFRVSSALVREDVIKTLLDEYGYDKSDVNRKIRLSDIIALIDNLDKVDYLDIKSIYLKPYLRPLNHTNPCYSNIQILSGSVGVVKWKLQFDGLYMRLYKNGVFQGNITIDSPFIDNANIMKINIIPSSYAVGEEWEFYTHPFSNNLETTDFTVPVMLLENIQLNVNEQTTL